MSFLLYILNSPWKQAILYVLGNTKNAHYDEIYSKQFFDLDQHTHAPLTEFIETLCINFTRYQRFTEDGQYQIIPTAKQKKFLEKIICGEECFHFSEVGSGKTKVILPLLCQTFLSNNAGENICFYCPQQLFSIKSIHVIFFLRTKMLINSLREVANAKIHWLFLSRST